MPVWREYEPNWPLQVREVRRARINPVRLPVLILTWSGSCKGTVPPGRARSLQHRDRYASGRSGDVRRRFGR